MTRSRPLLAPVFVVVAACGPMVGVGDPVAPVSAAPTLPEAPDAPDAPDAPEATRLKQPRSWRPVVNVTVPEVPQTPDEPRLPGGPHVFEVWAPFADAVFVAGDFNEWNADVAPLLDAGDGYFRATVLGVNAGDEYLFAVDKDGDRLWRGDPAARRVVNSAGNSVVHDPDSYAWSSSFTMPPRDQLVVYELHIGTFNDEAGGKPGTFTSAIARLDHLVELGINTIEVMPVGEFGGDYSWGYNGAFLFAPESAYGTPDEMKAFVDACHSRGIAVVIDVVHNHWGPSDLPMWCFDGECLGANNGGAYFYADWRRESGWGPRPDYGRPQVRQLIEDNTRMWLQEYRLDGMRWDSTVNIRTGNGSDIPDGWRLLQDNNNLVDAIAPHALMIAEDLQNNEWLTKTTGAGGAGFDAQWDAGFFHPVNDTLEVVNDANRDLGLIKEAILRGAGGVSTRRVIYTESHDEVANGRSRLPAMIDRNNASSLAAKKRSTLGAVLVMTSPGVPMLFQGQELLEDGWFRDTVPIDWEKRTLHTGIFEIYRDLIAVRKNAAGTTVGLSGGGVAVHHVNNSAKVLAFKRWKDGGDDVVVVVNFSNRAFQNYEIGLPQTGTWHVRVNTDEKRYDDAFSGVGHDVVAQGAGMDGQPTRGTVALGPWSAQILSR